MNKFKRKIQEIVAVYPNPYEASCIATFNELSLLLDIDFLFLYPAEIFHLVPQRKTT